MRTLWVVVNGRRLLAGLCLLFVLLFLAWLPGGIDRWRRARFGVAPGVTLAGQPVGGWWEPEVRELVLTLAEEMRTEPADAAITSSGTIAPSRAGRRVDVDTTVQAVLNAQAGESVEPVFVEVPPAVTEAYFTPVYRGDPSRPRISLAINVDWGADVLPEMLRTLDELHLRVTFFVTGRFARKFPDLVRQMVRAGHELGTHGAEHVHPSLLTNSELDKLIREGARILHDIAGVETNLFAPPYGEVNERIARRAGQLGFRTIMWTIDTVDWTKKSADEIQQRVLSRLENGAIVLAHPMPETVKALSPLAAAVRARGFTFVPVGEILE
ncbi:MAG: polysaccharide deacetylase family protein [Limnochordales bacterium]|nr:polysaccharide deacetylase family protein [Limnochordales bacterium]